MANVFLRLDLAHKTDGEIHNWESNIYNNVSKKHPDNLEKNKGLDMLIVGDKIKDNMLYPAISQYNGICGGLTDEQGVLSNNLKLTIVGTNRSHIDNITVYFDKTSKQFATECIIDGKTYHNDDYIWALKWNTPSESKTITFTKWNRPTYCGCITYLDIELDNIELGKHNIKNINSLRQINPIQDEPFYDVISNIGEFNIRDNNGEFLDYAIDGILEQGSIVKIFINDKEYANHIISEWNEPNKAEMTIGANLTDTTNKLVPLFSGYYLSEETNAYDYLVKLLNDSGINYNLSFVEEYLKQIIIKYPYLKNSTYREAVIKFCQLAQMCAYVVKRNETENELLFVSARPLYKNNEKIINITANSQESDFNQVILPKNNYKSVDIEENIVNKLPIQNLEKNIYSVASNNEKIYLTGKKAGANSYIYKLTNNFEFNELYNFADLGVSIETDINTLIVENKILYLLDNSQHILYQNEDGDFYKIYETSYVMNNFIYKNNRLVIVGNGRTFYSDDLKQFYVNNTQQSNSTGGTGLDSIIYLENKFYASTNSGAIYSSEDGKIFTKISYHYLSYSRITSAGNKMYQHSESSSLSYYSIDGINWNTLNYGIQTITYYNNKYIMIDRNGNIYDSLNGIDFNIIKSISYNFNTNISFFGIFNNNLILIISGKTFFNDLFETKILYSNDGNYFFDFELDTKYQKNTYPLNAINTDISLQSNELIQNNTLISKIKASEVICNNIISDYSAKNGIRTATLTVNCGVDFYDTNGNIAVSWNKDIPNIPNTLQLGQLVRVLDRYGNSKSKYSDKTDRIFRITGIEFIHEIIPKWKLELMEVIRVD